MMRLPERFRTLQAHYLRWVFLPFSFILIGLIAAGILAYQQIVTSLVMDRDRQLATLSALRVSEIVEGYAQTLETWASNSDIQNRAMLAQAAAAMPAFNAGIMLADRAGNLLASAPISPALPQNIAGAPYFEAIRTAQKPTFSDVLTSARTGAYMVVVAVPITGADGQFAGALLGVIDPREAALGAAINRLNSGSGNVVYIVDRQGRVIYHPNAAEIGANHNQRFPVAQIVTGLTGATAWTSQSGQHLIMGYAPVTAAGWGLIVQESWETAVAPVQEYGALFIGLALVSLGGVALLSLRSLQRVTAPVKALAAQTNLLAHGESVAQLPASGILELDLLERSFAQMVEEITTTRAGMRRYVGAITQSQEEERRRIARELHDETIQSLLSIARRLELYQTGIADPLERAKLTDIQGFIDSVIHGLRRISRDLRPPVLEELGLVAALQNLVSTAPQTEDALRISLDVLGEPVPLTPEQELALYRIAQEALNNVRKHAAASEAMVTLSFEPRQVTLEVRDNGTGFDVPVTLAALAQGGNFGLMGIQERVWAVGGLYEIQSARGKGTRLQVTIQLRPSPAGALFGP